MEILDVHSQSLDPIAKGLSNFAPYAFELDGIKAASMEGFLQSLKFNDERSATVLRSMIGYQAFKVGQEGNGWKETQTLYWNGAPYARSGQLYQRLLVAAYDAWYDHNPVVKQLLLTSVGKQLRHLRGKSDPRDSVLIESEYIAQLERLRFRSLEEKTDEKLHRD